MRYFSSIAILKEEKEEEKVKRYKMSDFLWKLISITLIILTSFCEHAYMIETFISDYIVANLKIIQRKLNNSLNYPLGGG